MQSEEIASCLNLTRHTIAEYLEILRAKEGIHEGLLKYDPNAMREREPRMRLTFVQVHLK